jgi:regulator of cell morphogenesis and NO signaling
MTIDATKTTIGQLALELPNAIAVFEKWDIDYCCRGGRTLEEACRTAGVTAGELLAAISTLRSEQDDSIVKQKSLLELQRYIVETHHTFTRTALDTVRILSDKVASRHGGNHPETIEVQKIVTQLIDDLLPHMLKEEQVLFPYVAALEDASENGNPAPVPFFGTVANPVRMMMMEHDSVGVLLTELRTATSEYALPADACLSFRALYERLIDLEQDLHRHIHLENNLLFPRAVSLEENAGSTPSFGVKGDHCSCAK